MNEQGISKIITHTLKSKGFPSPVSDIFDLKHSILNYYKLDLLIENRWIPEVRLVENTLDAPWLRGLFILLTTHVKTCSKIDTYESPIRLTPIYKKLIVEVMGDNVSSFILSDDIRVD
jgi:hypothetical protein